MDLFEKRALVNGGLRGTGAAIAIALADNGADVAFNYQRSAERAASVVGTIEEKGERGLAIQADNAAPDAIRRAVSQTADRLKRLDTWSTAQGFEELPRSARVWRLPSRRLAVSPEDRA